MAIECNSTFDCEVIRDNGDIIDLVCFGEDEDKNITGECDCDNLYGYTGALCEDSSIQTVWIGIYNSAQLIMATLGFIGTAYLAWNFFKLNEQFRESNKILLWTFLFMSLSFFFEFFNSIGNLIATSDQKFMQHVAYETPGGTEETVFGPYGIMTIFNLYFVVFFFCLVCMCMMFLWLNVIQRTNKVLDETMFKKINNFKLSVKVVVGIVFLLSVVLMIAKFFIVAMLLSIFFVIPTAILTWRARVLFINGISSAQQTEDTLTPIIRRTRSYSLVLLITLVVMAIAFLIYGSVGYDAISDQRPGKLLVAEMPLQLTAILKSVALLNTISFINFIMTNMKSNTTTKSSAVGTSAAN